MKYIVNENCIGCGLCAEICPDVFSLSDAGFSMAADKEVDNETNDLAQEAMNSCPVDAIEEA